MIGFDLSRCIHKKRAKMRNILALYDLLYLVHTLILSILSHSLYFFKCFTPSQNVEFRVHGSGMEIGLSQSD